MHFISNWLILLSHRHSQEAKLSSHGSNYRGNNPVEQHERALLFLASAAPPGRCGLQSAVVSEERRGLPTWLLCWLFFFWSKHGRVSKLADQDTWIIHVHVPEGGASQKRLELSSQGNSQLTWKWRSNCPQANFRGGTVCIGCMYRL